MVYCPVAVMPPPPSYCRCAVAGGEVAPLVSGAAYRKIVAGGADACARRLDARLGVQGGEVAGTGLRVRCEGATGMDETSEIAGLGAFDRDRAAAREATDSFPDNLGREVLQID